MSDRKDALLVPTMARPDEAFDLWLKRSLIKLYGAAHTELLPDVLADLIR